MRANIGIAPSRSTDPVRLGDAPTWTGSHTFSAGLAASSNAGIALATTSAAATQLNALTLTQGAQAPWYVYQPGSSTDFRIYGGGADRLILQAAGAVLVPGSLAVTGALSASNFSGSSSGTNTGDQVIPANNNPATYAQCGGL